MKGTTSVLTSIVAALAISSPAVLMTGCETSSPGVRSNYVQQWTTVEGDLESVAEAAEDALNDLKLREVDSRATSVDAMATGLTADGTEVTVDIQPVTDNTSQISVRVGTTGDPDLGVRIVNKIEDRLDESA